MKAYFPLKHLFDPLFVLDKQKIVTNRLSGVNSSFAKLVGQLDRVFSPSLHEDSGLGSVGLLVSAKFIPGRQLLSIVIYTVDV